METMRRWTAVIILLMLPVFPGSVASQAPSAADDDEAVIQLLSAYHGLPEQELFEAASDDPTDVLRELAVDSAITSIHRERAISALAYWPTEKTWRTYQQILEMESDESPYKHAALSAMSRGFGEDALPTLRPYATHENDMLRRTMRDAIWNVETDELHPTIRSRHLKLR